MQHFPEDRILLQFLPLIGLNLSHIKNWHLKMDEDVSEKGNPYVIPKLWIEFTEEGWKLYQESIENVQKQMEAFK